MLKPIIFSAHHLRQAWILFLCLLFFRDVEAQRTPAELADLSLQELSSLKLDRELGENTSRWNFHYKFRYLKFDGYRDGTENLSNSEVLFNANIADRTNKNFPTIPTIITQQAHIFSIGYRLDQVSYLNLSVPYLEQKTDHISNVPEFSKFTIVTRGIGDLTLSYTRRIWGIPNHQLSLHGGISFPTGSINEKGNTPIGPGNQQLAYTMQLGSGTYDFPIGAGYYGDSSKLSWGLELFAKLRTGNNSRDYRLGNRYFVSTWLQGRIFDWLEPSVKFTYQYANNIHGTDEDLLVPGPFPFPASITNPDFYGGTIVNIFAGIKIKPGYGLLKHFIFDVELGKPIYQSLNGPQPKEDYQINANGNWYF